MLANFRAYFREALWNFPLSQERGFRYFGLRWLRIAYLTLRGFYRDQCTLSASSLTYYTIMSVVPGLALAFAAAKWVGSQERLTSELLHRFPDQQAAFLELFKYANTLLEQTKEGIIASFGFAVLCLTVALLLHNLEVILNHIWNVKKQRSFKRILTDYFAIILIAPIFFIFANSMMVFVVESLEKGIQVLPMGPWAMSWLSFFVHLIPYALFGILFTFLYFIVPNRRVSFASAAIAGMFAGALYIFVQLSYIYFQLGVNQYGAVYGSVAAAPLFFVWVQVSWFVFLLGAELSSAHQRVDEHEFEGSFKIMSSRCKRLITLSILRWGFKKRHFTLETLRQEIQIPLFVANPILEELKDSHLIYLSKEGYEVADKLGEMRISDCIKALEWRGENQFSFIDSKTVALFEHSLNDFEKWMEKSPTNTRIGYVPDSI